MEKEQTLEPIPGPKGLPVVGNLFDIDLSNGLQSMMRLAKEHGPIFRVTIGGQTAIFAASRDIVDEFCDESRFHKVVTGGVERLRPIVHDGLFTARHEEEGWAVAHRILVPALGPMKIREMFGEMHDIAVQLCLKLARTGPSTPINIAEDFARLTLDTLALCTMNFRFNSFYRGDKTHPFVQAIVEVLHEADMQSCFPDFINSLRFRSTRRMKRNANFMRQLSRDILHDRRSNPSEVRDLLHALYCGRDPVTGKGLEEDQIINNLLTFLVAGHETTAGLLGFALYYLLANPRALDKAKEEVDEVIGTNEIKVEHLAKLSYLDAVMKEALRLMPTAPGFNVASSTPQIVGGKYLIQPGESAIILLPASQRDRAVFGDDPEEFRPERMLKENFDNLPRNSWKPFGNGQRGCIGKAFAWQESLLIFALLLQNLDMEMDDPSYQLQVEETLTIKPSDFNIRVQVRQNQQLGLSLKVVTPKADIPPPTPSTDVGFGEPMTILYGSNSGSCRALAYRLASNAAAIGFGRQRILTLDEAVDKLPTDQPVIIITTTYNGQPTDDASAFFHWIENCPPGSMNGVSYAVFGCGHRDWIQDFHRIPILIDQYLKGAGAQSLAERGAADAAISDLYSDLETWEDEQLWPSLRTVYSLPPQAEVVETQAHPQVHVAPPLRLSGHSKLQKVVVTRSGCFTSPGEPEKRYLQFAIPPDSDHLAPDHLITTTSFHAGGLPVDTPLPASELFGLYVELAQPATPKNVQALLEISDDDKVREELAHMVESYQTLVKGRLSVLDLLEGFPSHPISLASFISMLPGLRLRTYSVSSSLRHDPMHGSLIYSVLKAPHHYNLPGRDLEHLGVGSNYLASLTPGSILYTSMRAAKPAFHLPEDQSATPIVMICAGTGLAPFMSFIEERVALLGDGETLAPGLLIFGCRHPDRDDLCFEQLAQWEALGAIQVKRAYSQAAEHPSAAGCRYVQHRVMSDRDEIQSFWDQGAKFYVCGGSEMVQGVRHACEEILGDKLTELDDFLEERYVAEIF